MTLNGETEVPLFDLLGINVASVDYETVLKMAADSIRAGRHGRYICASPAHPLALSIRDLLLKRALKGAWMVVPDGMSVVWAIRLLGANISTRVYGPELMLQLCQLAEHNGYRIFLLGATPETLALMQHRLTSSFPSLIVAGVLSPPFRQMSPREEMDMVDVINRAYPQILFVGLGCPKQEKWMAQFCPRIRVPLTLGAGAAFDFIAGTKKQSPRWVQKAGFEWLYRLGQEPRRLFSRYMIFNSLFAVYLGKQLMHRASVRFRTWAT